MIVQCPTCGIYYDDTYRWTRCPHDTFLANDGKGNFKRYLNSYISYDKPSWWKDE